MSHNTKPATTFNIELRRLQQTLAVVIACQAAASDGAEFDVADALAVVVGLLGESLRGIDQLELAGRRHGQARQ